MSRIVLIAPSGLVNSALMRLKLPSVVDSTGIISWAKTDLALTGSTVSPDIHVIGRAASSREMRITSALSGNAIGRNLLRLLPVDPARKLYRAVRRDSSVRKLVSEADIVVVTERDGILTGWHAGRDWAKPGAQVVYGLASAESLLAAGRG